MATLSLHRPERHTVLRSFAGHLEAAPDAVFRALVGRFGHLTGGDVGKSLVDEASHTVIVQGAWWYRGEYRARPEGTGTLLEYEIVNVAPTWHWAGPIAGRGEIRAAPAGFQSLLTELENEASA